MIALLYACGPRRAELVGLDLADVNITEDDGEHWGKLTVRHGKGNKERNLPVAGGALDALQDWLIVRGDAAGPLFVPINKGGVLALGQRLTSQAIYDLLAKRGAAPSWRTSRRTTCGAHSSATCSTKAPTSPPSRSWPATRR